jgi:hypothetical protein
MSAESVKVLVVGGALGFAAFMLMDAVVSASPGSAMTAGFLEVS